MNSKPQILAVISGAIGVASRDTAKMDNLKQIRLFRALLAVTAHFNSLPLENVQVGPSHLRLKPLSRITRKSWALVKMDRAAREPRLVSFSAANSDMSTT